MSLLDKLRQKWAQATAKSTTTETTETGPIEADATEALAAADILAKENVELKAEIAKRDEEKAKADADAKAAQEKSEAEAAAKLEAEKKARIDANVKAFEAKCVNAGKGATATLCSRYRAALEADDPNATKDFEALAASYPPAGATARVSENGPSAEEMAKRVKVTSETKGQVAAERLKARGVRQNTPEWKTEYAAELKKLDAEMQGGASGA